MEKEPVYEPLEIHELEATPFLKKMWGEAEGIPARSLSFFIHKYL